MALKDFEALRDKLVGTDSLHERLAILDAHPNVERRLGQPNFFRSFLQGLTPECECALKQLAAIDQVIDLTIHSAEKWRELLTHLLSIDSYYRELGGIVGYQVEILKLLKGESVSCTPDRYHSPVFDDISEGTPKVEEAIRWGLEAMPSQAELYPLGGAADRLHLVDDKTGQELPAAKLRFVGRTLLETLVRDLQAREWLYYRLFGRQLTTPIAIMTSMEKDNHNHVLRICEEHGWFGRPKESFRFFVQPLVPTVDENGAWHLVGPLKLYLKPGGHGAIWKLARDEGVFRWLKSLGRTVALVRQINNPAAGLDYGLLAFMGIGWKQKKAFGFASCPRLVKSAEGMNVLVEKPGGEIVLTNIEYTDFAKFGIKDQPLKEGEPFSRFSSNTNILFADLGAVERAVERCPFPGLLINVKPGTIVDETGVKKEAKLARLESTMQNLADAFVEPKNGQVPLQTTKTFVTYNKRTKTISVAKKAHVPGGPLLETPEQCFYELLQENRNLLVQCGVKLPPAVTANEYLHHGPDLLFLYHPALGPLYSIIQQKIRGGHFGAKAELLLEIGEAVVENLHLSGSLQIRAERTVGVTNSEGHLCYSLQVGRCILRDVTVENLGVDWKVSAPFWKMDLRRSESVQIELLGHSEFIAEQVQFRGSHRFVVKDGIQMRVVQRNGRIEVEERRIDRRSK